MRACNCDDCEACTAHWTAEEAAYQIKSAEIRATNEATRLANEETLDAAWLRLRSA